MTEFNVEAVLLWPIEKHPNADSLSITQVHGGYPCIIKTGDFSDGDIAVYVPVDSLVPVSRPEFEFLSKDANADGFARIKARRLRGVFSMGLLVNAPKGVKEGDDCQSLLGVEKWLPLSEREPVQQNQRKRSKTILGRLGATWLAFKRMFGFAPPPPPSVPVYDIEGLRKHKHLLKEGDEVVITEKIHGCNARFVHTGKRFYIGSRTQFRAHGPSVWHAVAEKYQLESIMKQYPGAVLFGEAYGPVQDLKYGITGSDVGFAVFDVLWKTETGARYMNFDDLQRFCGGHFLPMVPVLYRGPWREDLIELAEGKTTISNAGHVREGIVIRPPVERIDPHFGRVQLKLHGEGYLTRKSA